MPHCTRRRTLASTIAIVSLAGCQDLISDVAGGGPDPRVTDTQSGQDLGDALSGRFDIRVLVVNDGETGDVEVTVTTYDSAGNVLDRFNKVVEIREGESRRVDFAVSPSDGAERYGAEADAA